MKTKTFVRQGIMELKKGEALMWVDLGHDVWFVISGDGVWSVMPGGIAGEGWEPSLKSFDLYES